MGVWRNCGLTIVLTLMFLFSVAGHLYAGRLAHNEELEHQGKPPVESILEYARTPDFRSTLYENWESEFLQMALFVFLTMFLYQRGSSESNPLPDEGQEENIYPKRYFKNQPVLRKLYEHSLCIALFSLFAISFWEHARGSYEMINDERAHYGKPAIEFTGVFTDPEFWFESFQNWQSEFFSVAVLVVLSIFLRQKDSAQSKEVDAPHLKTGGD